MTRHGVTAVPLKQKKQMETTNAFDAAMYRSEHAQEIAQSRVGCLGGSDAAMVLRVFERGGVEGLNATDKTRLCVCFGVEERANFGGNKWTEAGRNFEDTCDKLFAVVFDDMEREKLLTDTVQYQHFKSIAHADFVRGGNIVYECKCVAKKATATVINAYYAQLQWYYMLGVECVHIVHGVSGDDTAPTIETIDRNDGVIQQLREGLRLIDEGYASIVDTAVAAKVADTECSNDVQELLRKYRDIDEHIKLLQSEQGNIKSQLWEYMRENGIGSISGDVSARYTPAMKVKTINKKKLLALFPDIATADVYDITKRNGSLTMTVAKKKGGEQ